MTANAPRTIEIGRHTLSVRDVAHVVAGEAELVVSSEPAFRTRMAELRAALDRKLQGPEPLYGIKTGFGASCTEEVDANLAQLLASNLFRYHGCGMGAALTPDESAAVLVCRLAQLATGHSAIRVETLDALAALLRAGVLPRIPQLGSVGASGDLTPMSYVAAVLEGDREAFFREQLLPAKEALTAAGLAPWKLLPKESLSIMNGTSVMTALLALGAVRLERFARMHATLTAWNSFLLGGQAAHFDARIFQAKPHPGSIRYAEWVRNALGVTANPAPHAGKVQDPYSLRCAPHVVGVLLEALEDGTRMIHVELNGAGDNPLFCPDTSDVLHGGNFYGGHMAHVADVLKVQAASAAEVLERQLMLLCHAPVARGLPENLVLATGDARVTHHGMKALEICASALVAEALKTSTPASTYSRSTEGHNQDKVPMGTLAARELRTIVDLGEQVMAIGLLAAAQATDALLRAGTCSALPPKLHEMHTWVRETCPVIEGDQRTDLMLAALIQSYENVPVEGES